MIPVARLSVRLAGQNVGQLGLGERGRIYVSIRSWLDRAGF